VAGAGDLNEDGFDDVLVSVYGGGASSSLGVVRAYSGEWIASMSQGLVPATPEFLYEAHKENGGGFGDVTVASVGFVDADSVPDFAVGSPFAPMVFVQVHSGADGSLLWSATNASGDLDRFGASLAGVGDIDGDGHAEVAVGAYLDDTKAVDSGAVWVFSGLDGAALMTFFGDGVTTHGLGSSVTGAGDMNADGYPDVAAGAQYFGASNNGSIRVVSGEWIASSAAGRPSATPEILLHAEGENPFDLFGGAIGFAGDVNADGVSDLVVGAKWFNAAGSADSGAAYMISGKALSLASMEHKLSLSAGGAHELALSAPGARAGDLYVVLGSASGTKPGTPIGGLPLPLNYDPYTRVSAALANAPPFVAFVGFLDAAGEATARFELPPGIDPALAGLTLDHAFVAIDSLSFPAIAFVSNAVPVTLVP
jgi:hypothetical protein